MAKKVTKKDLRELIVECLKKAFPRLDNDGCFHPISEAEKMIIMDSIYIIISDMGKFSKREIRRLNKYFRKYTGKNLVCTFWDENCEALIIKNEYKVID